MWCWSMWWRDSPGKALDLLQAGPVAGFDVNVIGTNSYEDTRDSDVVVITAGVARKPGMSRDDLLQTNFNIIRSVVEQVVQYSPNAFMIVVSNPVDVMTYAAYRISGWPKKRVMGMAGVLDLPASAPSSPRSWASPSKM